MKLRLHREFAAAAKLIESLVQLRNAVKSRYDRVLQWLQVSECRTGTRRKDDFADLGGGGGGVWGGPHLRGSQQSALGKTLQPPQHHLASMKALRLQRALSSVAP